MLGQPVIQKKSQASIQIGTRNGVTVKQMKEICIIHLGQRERRN